MYNHNKVIIQIGSHIGNTTNDPIFNKLDNNTTLILVEPVPYLFEQLKENYREKYPNHSGIIFINKAVTTFIGEIELHVPSEKNDFTQFPSWFSQLASIRPNHIYEHHLRNPYIPFDKLLIEKMIVPTTTLDQIIQEHNIQHIDLLQTDTEGHDYDILINYTFEIKPNTIMFKHLHMDGLEMFGIRYNILIHKLESMEYRMSYCDEENVIFNKQS
jgi:FkbM family methyltransferase